MFSWPPAMTIWQARLDDSLARRVLADAGGEYLAQDRFADQVGIDAGLGQQTLDDVCAQFGRRSLGEGAAEFAHTSTACGHDYYIIHVILQSAGVSPAWLAKSELRSTRSYACHARGVAAFDAALPRKLLRSLRKVCRVNRHHQSGTYRKGGKCPPI